MDISWLKSMLQTTDPLFPIGSYAHSYGMEELCAQGVVHDQSTLLKYIETSLHLNLRTFELPYLRFAYDANLADDFTLLSELDQEIGAAKPSREIRQASASQGKQRLRLISKLRPTPRFARLAELQERKQITPHHLSIFAAENVDLETPLSATLTAWAYQAIAAPCAASLKLIRIGQEGAQLVLTQALENLQSLIDDSMSVDREYAGAFLPTIDIASDRHERAFARLFIS
ncbi:urease accessory UreF family protein [Pelagicoccus sp. SDUM812003]|uniref:urease accessory protein UreF n=1 Tax=Pelagicoccus sp. SDUM812003 TaxID=3041267 RepID=UPI00280DCEC5|nr:urease accessory UreF family protein [Pelagicoccus sp. SDUM812003]MDQ8201637.1 urease accessory UreF family protein [Pelagicoccus sp. SDUM812003]